MYKDIETLLCDEKVSNYIKYFDEYIQFFGMANNDDDKTDLEYIRYMNWKGNTTIKFLEFYKNKKMKDEIPEDIK